MTDIMIIGGGGHGLSAFDVLMEHPDYNILGYIDHAPTKAMASVPINYLGSDDDFKYLIKDTPVVALAIGQIKTSQPRIDLSQKLITLGVKFPAISSTKSSVSYYANIGQGSMIFHHATVNADSHIGQFNIINTAAVIEHGVMTKDFVHIAPRAVVLGDASIGYGSFVGAGAIIREGISIGQNCIIGAGVTIRHDIDNNSIITASS